MTVKKCNLILSCVLLGLGGTIYILFRENTYIANFTEKFIYFDNVRSRLYFLNCNFLKYYFTDFTWAFSLCCGLFSFYPSKVSNVIKIGLVTFLLGTIWEIIQYIGIIKGTGDVLDLMMYLSASVIAVTINIIIILRRKT